MDDATYIAHQFVLRDFVEELLQVYVNYPLHTLVEVFQKLLHGLLAAPAGAEAVAAILELCLEDGREDLDNGLLKGWVDNDRDTKLAYSSVGLRCLNPPNGSWFVPALKDGLLDTRPVGVHVAAEFFDFHAVYT